jgi:hypothetical protein
LKEKIKTLKNKNIELKVLYEVEKSKRDALLREICIKTEEFLGLETEVAELREKVGTLEKQLAAAMMEEDSDEDSE